MDNVCRIWIFFKKQTRIQIINFSTKSTYVSSNNFFPHYNVSYRYRTYVRTVHPGILNGLLPFVRYQVQGTITVLSSVSTIQSVCGVKVHQTVDITTGSTKYYDVRNPFETWFHESLHFSCDTLCVPYVWYRNSSSKDLYRLLVMYYIF